MIGTYFFSDKTSTAAALGLGLGFWLIFGALTDIAFKAGVGKHSLSIVFSRLKGLPLSVFGTAFAHAGIGLTVIGLVSVTTLQIERIVLMKPNDVVEAGGYTLKFSGVTPFKGPNFTEDQARFDLTGPDGRRLGEIAAAKRLYPARGMPTTEAGIRTFGLSQLYVSIGEATPNGLVVHAWWKPRVTLIWIGALVMMFGGGLSLCDRRLRVGAPTRRKTAVEAEA